MSVQPASEGSPTQVDLAVELLRDRIMDLTIEPGSRIDERLLVEQFGLGRTPSREALNRLVSEGFVQIRPARGGAVVTPLGFQDFGELIEAYQFCESILGLRVQPDHPQLYDDLCAIQARYRVAVEARDFLLITQINIEFHMRLHETLRNSLIRDFALKMHRLVARVLNYTYANELPETLHQAEQFRLNLEQHDAIIEAVRLRDKPTLAKLLPDHAGFIHHRLVYLLDRRLVAAEGLEPPQIG
ncbi:GntR family transcriptional regulator [Ketogulonicigenium vulgare]|uniref:AsnC/GntR family transcriptional regulator protein n=1 Tax=Ketogulonicigenium vulgare (strain WSH-001) TaxID=759362 RepID=F9Y8X4_KETVW|nr:GntR family transcriptional regulator [Ketogulonicigenium vulgare]ADO41801.1 transcription regulator family protein [Ketogulonicigenium vulgare Y25]AEM40030.1 AsnC/GntR family transcriptional regulator protein [Ketogulonicigenium vulgare WSH-001]ALJ80237.1 AsnC family transcriptional regulator [Ketogulonicigenium vulgare]ANW33096.1 AsnC family transcriptional regulator [Ketogulonicigenium vulgare]AOZ53731.1 transcription regulator family protein [Ketogulonicigenium vulgare]